MKVEHVDQIKAAASALRERVEAGKVKNIYFVACGGSQATMMSAQYMFDREITVPSAIYNSNEFNYGTPKAFGEDSVVITCSHSGTTPETVAAAQKATDAGALSIAFSNVEGSPLWEAANLGIHYDHGKEAADIDKGGPVMLRTWFQFLTVLDPENAEKWSAASETVEKLPEIASANVEKFREKVESYATANKRSKLIYTMGSGANFGEMYSLAICWFMEMQWVNSNAIHSGEYFHGPFEITDYDVPFIITMSNGATRYLDERAVAFAKKFSDDLLIVDEAEFDLPGVDEAVTEYFAAEVLSSVIRCFILKFAFDTGHSLDVRRYMWQMEY